MKLCTTCDHHRDTPEGHVCLHPELLRVNRVTGEPVPPYCQDERADTGRCGELAAYHETEGEPTE